MAIEKTYQAFDASGFWDDFGWRDDYDAKAIVALDINLINRDGVYLKLTVAEAREAIVVIEKAIKDAVKAEKKFGKKKEKK